MAGGTYAKQNLNFYNLSFLVSLNLPWKSEPQWVKLKDSGEATPQYVPKAPLSAEPPVAVTQAVGGSSVLNLCDKDQANENCEHRPGI